MEICFWGTRGSIPAPLSSNQIRARIAAVVQRISEKDIETPDAREHFLSTLPDSIYTTVGSNTSCIEVSLNSGETLVFDAGSGIREFGNMVKKQRYHIFFSHFHWDHIQGLPFFAPIYKPDTIVHFYSPVLELESILREQMRSPYFPIPMSACTKQMYFHMIPLVDSIPFGDAQIIVKKMRHPGDSYSYAIIENGKKCIYATDVELAIPDFERTVENSAFFADADILILDAQYTLEEALEKENWGHSSFSYAIDFAIMWNIKKLFLFHHEPNYDDKKLNSILETARWYAGYVGNSTIQIELATEGLSIPL